MSKGQKILVVGATGTVGRFVVREMAARHEVIEAGRVRGSEQVDITDGASIRALFERVGRVDAIVSTTGELHFGPLAEMNAEQFKRGLHSKLLGQVELALVGQHFLNDESIARDIADALTLKGYKNVLEIGPGMGVLTKYVLDKPINTYVIEIDTESVDYLNAHYPKLH